MTIAQEVQKFNTGTLVELFELDLSPIGGTTIFRFMAGTRETEAIQFDGNTYTPIDVEAKGFKWDAKGTFPKPTMRVSNVAGLVSASIIEYNDLVGAQVTRIKTFEQFLDDGSDPDPTAIFPLEIYTIDQKLQQNAVFVEWRLASAIDQEGRKLPGRVCLRDRCTQRYRIYDSDSGSFNYDLATCPYTGVSSYDETGSPTTDDSDNCGRRLSDCQLRFGQYAELYSWAFPGIARVRLK